MDDIWLLGNIVWTRGTCTVYCVGFKGIFKLSNPSFSEVFFLKKDQKSDQSRKSIIMPGVMSKMLTKLKDSKLVLTKKIK